MRVVVCLVYLPRRVAGNRVGIAGARSGAEHPGLVGVGGPRHPREQESHSFCTQKISRLTDRVLFLFFVCLTPALQYSLTRVSLTCSSRRVLSPPYDVRYIMLYLQVKIGLREGSASYKLAQNVGFSEDNGTLGEM